MLLSLPSPLLVSLFGAVGQNMRRVPGPLRVALLPENQVTKPSLISFGIFHVHPSYPELLLSFVLALMICLNTEIFSN